MAKSLKTCYRNITSPLLHPSASVEPRRLQSSSVQRSLRDPSPYQPFTDSTPDIQLAQLSPVQGVVENLTWQAEHSALPTA